MKRTGFQRGLPQARPARDRSDEFKSFVVERPRVVMASNLSAARPVLKLPDVKTPERVKQSIRDSARGEECQVRLPGVCARDTAHTIWSHARWGAQLGDAGRAGAMKALDICGAYACTACDAAYDGQRQVIGKSRVEIDMDWCFAHFRSLAILKQKGLL